MSLASVCVYWAVGSDSVGAAAYLQYSKARTHILIRNSAGNIKYESNWTITRTLLIPNSDSYWILHLCCYQSPDQVYRASCGLSIITTEVEMEECSNILRTFLYHRSLGSNMLLSGKIRDSYNKTKSLKSRDRLSLKGANCQAHGPGLDQPGPWPV